NAVVDRPSHQAVDGDRRVAANAMVVEARHIAAARADDEPANAAVRHKDVRSAAEHRHRHTGIPGDAQHGDDLVAGAGLDQPLRRAADMKRRERRERHIRLQAIGAAGGSHGGVERAHACPASTAISVRSCAISAAIASRIVQTANEIVSPGPSWPATGMSAAITVAIFGYPPAVCRSAISRIGSPDAGTWGTPGGGASGMMAAPRTGDSG